MEDNRTPFSSEAATDEPASPGNPEPASLPASAEEAAYWRGVADGARLKAAPEPDHLPAGFVPEPLARDGGSPGLIASLSEGYVPVERDSAGRAVRHDGLTPARQRIYLDSLAACGVVADACRAAGVSRDTVYNLRNRAEGAAFALAWDAALLIARGRMGDELMSRAMNGCIDRVYRNGELVAERHRHDNRLAMAVLTRLDRQAEGLGERAPAARAAAQEWDQFLDLVEKGEDATDFLRIRSPEQVTEDRRAYDRDWDKPRSALAETAAALERVALYGHFGVGILEEADTSDLAPAGMIEWTDEQWDRAEYSGWLDSLEPEDWPEAARQATESDPNGNCPTCQDMSGGEGDAPAACKGLERLRSEYRRHCAAVDDEEEGAALNAEPAWEDEGCWWTDYPPPEGFDGLEEGEWGDEDYRRGLTPEEEEAVEAGLAERRAEEQAEHEAALAEARAARDAAFGFAGGSPPAEPGLDAAGGGLMGEPEKEGPE